MRPPLTRIELCIIHDRNRDQHDVNALLWEVARLRSRLLKVDQLHASLGDLPSGLESAMKRLRAELSFEPCVREASFGRPNVKTPISPPLAS